MRPVDQALRRAVVISEAGSGVAGLADRVVAVADVHEARRAAVPIAGAGVVVGRRVDRQVELAAVA